MEKSAIVIQGAPAVGKSTIARRLSQDLSIKLIAKDDIKECLYDALGAPEDRMESELYGRIAIRAMYAGLDEFVRAGKLVIVEAPLIPDYASRDILSVMSLDAVLQIYIFCQPAVLEQRFSQRVESGERHEGHGDDRIDARQALLRNAKIAGIETITVDTTEFDETNYASLLEEVRHRI